MFWGIIFGLIPAAAVWYYGHKLNNDNVKNHPELGFGTHFLFLTRAGLAVFSVAVLGLMSLVCFWSSSYLFFIGFALSYILGVVAYFYKRYHIKITIDPR
jgi:hypothetical protein